MKWELTSHYHWRSHTDPTSKWLAQSCHGVVIALPLRGFALPNVALMLPLPCPLLCLLCKVFLAQKMNFQPELSLPLTTIESTRSNPPAALLRNSISRLTRCIFQMPIEVLIIFSLDNQWSRLKHNQRLRSYWLDLRLFLEASHPVLLIYFNYFNSLSLD